MTTPPSLPLLLDGQPLDHNPAPIVEWQQVEFACYPPPGTQVALQIGSVALEPFLRPGEPAWRWRWNPQNSVGLFELLLTISHADGSFVGESYRLRVVPRKLDQEHYSALIADVQQVARALAYSLGGALEGAELADPPGDPSPLESYFAFLASGVERLRPLLAGLAANPQLRLRPHQHEQPIAEAAQLDPASLSELAQRPLEPAPAELLPELQRLLQPTGGGLPASLPAQHSLASPDTYENRLLKHLLAAYAARLRAYSTVLAQEQQRLRRNAGYVEAENGRLAAVERLVEQTNVCTGQLRGLRALPFLAEVGPLQQFHGPSQILQRDPRYRQVYRLWQELRRQPQLAPASDLLTLPIHDLPRLYEVWCVLRVARALLELPQGRVVEQRLIAPNQTDAAGLLLSLPEDVSLLTLAVGPARLSLRYQPRYRPLTSAARGRPSTEASSATMPGSLDRHTRVPDIALELHQEGELPRLWLLDAKYRLDSGGGAPQQALDDAYTYLGSVGLSDGQRAVRGAYLLYPGRGRAERYASGVGALPLLPANVDALHSLLSELD